MADKRNGLTTKDVLSDIKKRSIDVRDFGARRISLSFDLPQRRDDLGERLAKLLRRG